MTDLKLNTYINDEDMNNANQDAALAEQISGAFDAITLPDNVRTNTLAAIDTLRNAECDQSESVAQSNMAQSSTKQPNTAPPNAAQPNTAPASFNPDEAPASPRPNAKKLKVRRSAPKIAFGIAACLAFLLTGFFGFRYATEPTAYVDIDVNPSIELALNRFNYVVGAQALNADAKAVLDGVSVVGKPYSEALDTLMAAVERAGYTADKSFVEFSILSQDDTQIGHLETSTDTLIAACGFAGQCNIANPDVREAAHGCGMGVGKYLAAEELIAYDPSVTLEDCSHMSMRQLRDKIEAASGASVGADAGANSGSGLGAEASSPATPGGYGNGGGNGYGSGYGNGTGNGYAQGQGHGHNGGGGHSGAGMAHE